MHLSDHRVLVTGGAGYVGSACLRHFRRAGVEAWAFDDLSTGNSAAVPGGRLIVGDILDTAALTRAMRDHGVTDVLHAAALASVPESFDRPDAYWRVNLDGTRSVMAAMLSAGAGRIVFSSTAAVYRHGAARPIREDDPLDPLTPYGSSKLAAAHLIRDLAARHGLTAVELRYFNASGADPDGQHGEARAHETHAIPLLLKTADGLRPVFDIFGDGFDTPDGTCIRDYVSVIDLAEAHLRAVTRPIPGGHAVCNLGAGQGVSVRELFELAREVTGRDIAHRVSPPRPGDPAWLVADITCAGAVLDWRPTLSLRDILRSAWAWQQARPTGYAPAPAPRKRTMP
jgi:UDP-glucose 4-epimerase